MIRKLTYSDLRKTCDPASMDGHSSDHFSSDGTIIGQDRAVRAMHFGLDIPEQGFNIFVAGPPGSGRTTAVEQFLAEIARTKPTPPDWCYLENFEDNYHPRTLQLPAGRAREFQRELETVLKSIEQNIHNAFESDQYAAQQENTLKSIQEQKSQLIDELGQFAQKRGFGLQATPVGVIPIPIRDGKALSESEFMSLSEEEQKSLRQGQEKIREAVENAMRQTRTLDASAQQAVEQLDRQVAQFVLDNALAPLVEKFKELPEALAHLQAIKSDIVENLARFKPQGGEAAAQPPTRSRRPAVEKYHINVIVDNSKLQGAPVIVEMNPTYSNLFGRVEQEAYMGALVTDFTLIRGGSLHHANGGYLVLPAEDVIRNPYTWESLKRCLRNREIAIEVPYEQPVFTTKSLRPEPIPLNVKIILIGRQDMYNLLLNYDPQFDELFKVKAEFDSQMERTPKTMEDYAKFVCNLCNSGELAHLDAEALARVVEHGSRMAENQEKLSTRFGDIADVIREANYYARQEQAALIGAAHIERAIEERFYRSSLIQERIQELVARDVIQIDVASQVVGQANGLSVLQMGNIAFGQPSRITASVGMGKSGVVNVEREAQMSGPSHTKGVLILSGYLTQQFAQEKPLTLSARLVFEQNYGGVDGDSASSTELYAILSALAEKPLKQSIAVTGSVNQKGQVQAIGGVNEKIEGFYEVCKAKGLSGEQGVMIPASNTANLMLKQEIAEAVRAGKFHVWAVDTIEDGIEVLSGIPARIKPGGKRGAAGIFDLANRRLVQMANDLAKFGEKPGVESN